MLIAGPWCLVSGMSQEQNTKIDLEAEGTLNSAQDTPRPSSQHKGDLFAPEGQRAGNKRQTQEIEDEGEGNKGEGKGYLSWREPLVER